MDLEARLAAFESRLTILETGQTAVLNTLRELSREVDRLELRVEALQYGAGPISEEDFSALRREILEALTEVHIRVDSAARRLSALEARAQLPEAVVPAEITD